MTTNDAELAPSTRAMLAALDRRRDEMKLIFSPGQLGIVADRSKNGKRRPGSVRHRAIR